MNLWIEFTHVTDVLECLLRTIYKGYTVIGMDIAPKDQNVRVYVLDKKEM